MRPTVGPVVVVVVVVVVIEKAVSVETSVGVWGVQDNGTDSSRISVRVGGGKRHYE
jgi:hypothetical protein